MKYALRRLVNRLSRGRWIRARARFSRKVTDSVHGHQVEYSIDGDIGRTLYLHGDFEGKELDICRRYINKTSTVIDIGANIGLHTIFFAKLVERGLVVSFEPQIKVFDSLIRNLEGISNVIPVNVALNSVASIADFYIASDDAYSSLKDTRRKRIISKRKVITLPFDSFLSAFGGIDFVKIDVEGLEYEVLSSMRRSLERHRPVLFVEIYSGTNSNPQPEKTVMFLKEMGYKAYFVDAEGELQEHVVHSDSFYNYFFVHPNSASL